MVQSGTETETPMKRTLISMLLPAGMAGMPLFILGCDNAKQQTRTDQSLRLQVTPAHPVPATNGIAFAVVMDCSASMNEGVSDGRKIDIAREASHKIVRQAEMFSKAKDTPVKLAVYKFSDVPERVWPANESFDTPDAAQAVAAINRIKGGGGTAIGDAVIAATKDMNASGFTSVHILVVTDGQNTDGMSPDAVASEFAKLPQQYRPNVYVVAFDVNATVFDGVKANGWRVLSASNGKELATTLDSLVGGEILLEQ